MYSYDIRRALFLISRWPVVHYDYNWGYNNMNGSLFPYLIMS